MFIVVIILFGTLPVAAQDKCASWRVINVHFTFFRVPTGCDVPAKNSKHATFFATLHSLHYDTIFLFLPKIILFTIRIYLAGLELIL